ncbi:MAG: SPOR domain-containing protein [Flavobacteriales bacterium]
MDSLRHAAPLTPADVLQALPGMFWDHDCVMLPGLGGFVCNPRSAWYDEAQQQIVPPSRDVLFNPRLTTNDGLVANELMAKHGVAYPEALRAVDALVDALKAQLDEGATAELPGLGRLYQEDDAQLRFVADAEFERVLGSFGHASIALSPLESVIAPAPVAPVAAEEPKPQPKVVSLPKRDETAVPWRTQLARAAAAVAIPLTLGGAWLLSHPAGSDTMLGSNPLWNAVPVAATYAPAAHAALEVEEATPPAEGLAEFVERTGWEGLLEFDVEAGVPKAGGLRVMVPIPEPTPEPVVAEAVVAIEEAPVQHIKFLIVGGAFSVEANALNLAASLEREGFESSLHFQDHNQLTVVALGSFVTEGEAREALADARARGHEKAWLKRL